MDLILAQAIAEAYEGGLSLLKAAVKFGVSQDEVREALRLCNVGVRERRPTGLLKTQEQLRSEPRVKRMIEMRENGATLAEMASEFHLTRERVRQLLTRAGVDTSKDARPLKPEERAEAEAYAGKDGGNLWYHATRLGVSKAAFRNMVTRAGHQIRGEGGSDRSVDVMARARRVAELYATGQFTVEEIARTVGLSFGTAVYRDLARVGVRPDRYRRRPCPKS